MRLISVSLTNYRKYSDEFIEFPDGVTGILGNNGSGKSTIVEAIGWVLYGPVAARTKKEEIKRQDAPKGEDCVVVLEMEIGGDQYRLERRLEGANLSSSAFVYVNNKLAATGVKDTASFITRQLRLEREAFFTSFVAKQKELDFLSDLQPAQRKHLIIRMLGIDRVDTAIADLRQGSRTRKVELNTMRRELPDIESLRKGLEDKEEEFRGAGLKISEVEEQASILKDKGDKIREYLDSLEEKRGAYESLVSSLAVERERLANIINQQQNTLAEKEGLLLKVKEIARARPDVARWDEVREKSASMDKEKGKWERLKEIEERILELEAEERDCISRIARLEAEIGGRDENLLIKRRDELGERLKREERRRDEDIRLRGDITLAEQKLESIQRQLDNDIAEREELLEKVKRAEELRSEVDALPSLEEECADWERRRSEQKRLQDLEEYLRTLRRREEEQRRLIEELEGEVAEKVEVEKSVEGTKRAIDKTRDELKNLQISAQGVRVNIGNIQQGAKKIQKQKKTIDDLGPDSRCPVCSRHLGDDYHDIIEHFQQELDTLLEEEEGLKKELVGKRKKETELAELLKNRESESDRLQKELSELADAESQFKFRKQRLSEIKMELEETQEKLLQFGEVRYDDEAHLRATRRLDILRQKRDELIQLQGSLSRLPSLEERIDSSRELKRDLADGVKEFKHKLSELAFDEKKYYQWQSELEGARSELQSLQMNLNQRKWFKEREDGLQRELGKIHKVREDIGEVSYDVAEHNFISAELERLSAIRDRVLRLQAEVERLPLIEERIKDLDDNKKEVELRVAELTEQLNSLSFSKDELDKTRSEYEILQRDIHNVQLQLKDLIHLQDTIAKETENIKREIIETEAKEEEIGELVEEIRYLDELERVLIGFRTNLIGRIRPSLSRYASELFRELTDGKYLDMELDEDYEVHIHDRGRPYTIDHFSGGERDLANLCLRLAISQLIAESSGNEFSFIIMDEIFGSQDSIRKNNIMDALNNLSHRFRQIILITHVEDIKDSLEHLIEVTEDEEGISRAVLR